MDVGAFEIFLLRVTTTIVLRLRTISLMWRSRGKTGGALKEEVCVTY
jgi:hypothetical protein